MMKRALLASAFLSLGWLWKVSLASAEISIENTEPARVIFVYDSGKTYPIDAGAGEETYLNFGRTIQDIGAGSADARVKVVAEGNRLRIAPSKKAPIGTRFTVHVDFGIRESFFSIHVGPSKSAEKLIEVLPISRRAVEAEFEKYARKQRLELKAKTTLRDLGLLPAAYDRLMPVYDLSPTNPELLTFKPGHWDDEEGGLLLPFTIQTQYARPYQPALARVTDTRGNEYETFVAYYTDQTGADTGEVREVMGVISVVLDGATSIDKLRVELSEANEARMLAADVHGWNVERVTMQALTEAQLQTLTQTQLQALTKQEWLAQVHAKEQREARAKQIILGPRALYGGCWLADEPGGNNLDATGCTMLGASLTKGIIEMIAFEVEALGGWTGTAATGSARFGRITTSGVLRFGEWTNPYFRVGIGVQAGSVDGSSEFGFLLRVGGGVERRISNNILMGIGLDGGKSLDADNRFQRSLGIGVHISIGWNRQEEASTPLAE